MSTMRRLVLGLLLVLALPLIAFAEPAVEEKELKDWSFSFTPYFWVSNFRTDVDGQVIRGNVDQTAPLTKGAFMFIATASWRRWTVNFDGLFSNLGTTQVIGPVDVGFDVDQKILTTKVGYKILDSRTNAQVGGTALWANLGARNWITKPTISYTYTPILSDDPPTMGTLALEDSWWDPLVGASAFFRVTKTVHFFARGNVGGFGLGDSSDLTWDVGAYASFRIWRYAAIHAGHQALYYDRTAGEGDSAVRTKHFMSGLFFGASIFY
jgi:hypothetical protein